MQWIVVALLSEVQVLTSARFGVIGLLSFLYSFGVMAQLPPDINQLTPEAAYEKGELLRAQFKDKEARDYLQYAAEAGNVKAQYLYAMSLLTYHPTSRHKPIAKTYLIKAAQSDYRPAMFELYHREGLLSRDDQVEWKQRYLDALLESEKADSDEADFYLYQFYRQNERDEDTAEAYFDKALNAEQPLAMYEQAKNLQKGDGFYFFQSNRFAEMNEWLAKSASQGYIPAYRKLIQNYEAEGDYKNAYDWRVKLLQQGDLLSLASMGNILLGHSGEGYASFINKRLGLEYLNLYLKFAGTDRMAATYDKAKDNYDRAFKKLTEAEREQHEELMSSKLDSVQFVYSDRYFSH
ncbi:hypothetical protein ACGRL8_17570 [Vibrio rumoiensis]|uniref:hypothetical protein n=1 Tax=Vibrio rumoiensis TaxID=76258 RepID=UPI003748076D